MKHRVFFLWLGMVVAGTVAGMWYGSFATQGYLQESATLRPPVVVVRSSPWDPNELLVTTGQSGKSVWRWNIVTGQRSKLVLPALDQEAAVGNIISMPGSIVVATYTPEVDSDKYYLASVPPTAATDWKIIEVDGFVLDGFGDDLLVQKEGEQFPHSLFRQNTISGIISPLVELPSEVSLDFESEGEQFYQYKEFKGSKGLVRLVMGSKHIWRQAGDGSWVVVNTPPISAFAGGFRIVPTATQPQTILYDDGAQGMQASFDEGEHFESIQAGMGIAYAPYIFHHTPTNTIVTFTPSLQQAFVLNPDGRSWQPFRTEQGFEVLPTTRKP